MVNTIILNSKNLVSGNPNKNQLRYTFPIAKNLDHHQIALASIQIFYSWANIKSGVNDWYRYHWFDGQVYNVVIPAGFYTIAQLSAHLQSFMIAQGHYLVNNNTKTNVYFLEFVTNPTLYAVQINAYPLSSAFATANNWVLPVGATWTIPATPSIALINIQNTAFRDIVGMNGGTYPIVGTVSTSVIYSKASDYCPQVSPINSLVLSCSLLNSQYGNPTNILYSFAPDVSFGSLIDRQANEYAYNDIYPTHYNDFTITILDQNLEPIKIIDPSIVITLLIRDKNESR